MRAMASSQMIYETIQKCITPASPEWIRAMLRNCLSIAAVRVALATLVRDGKAAVVDGKYVDVVKTQDENEDLEVFMVREIGMPKNASKKSKKMDDKMDKKKGVKEGSPQDLAMDKKIVKKYK